MGASTGICLGKEWVTNTYQAAGWVAKKSDGWLGEGMFGYEGDGWLSRKISG